MSTIDLNEPPIFDLDHACSTDEHEDDRGAVIREGVTIPAELVAFGNGQLPATVLAAFGMGGHKLAASAAEAFKRLRAAAQAAGIDLTLSDSYRTLEQQTALKQAKGGFAATPGLSVHGWGFAVDLAIGSPPKPFGNSVLAWLKNNAPTLGWHMGRPTDEPWHWVYRGPQDIAPTTPTTTATPTTTPVVEKTVDTVNVKLGSTGLAVRAVQGLLGVTVTGTFDQATDTAVRSFQTANALKADGIVGPITWRRLRSTTVPAPQANVSLGASGAEVAWIQLRLGIEPEFGPKTDEAVKAFQTAKGLVVDGKVGPKTWAALLGEAPATPPTPPTPPTTPTPTANPAPSPSRDGGDTERG